MTAATTLTVSTDHAQIRTYVDALVAADPVRHTVMGTIGQTLEHSAWAAAGVRGLAVRSSANYPLVVAGDWTGRERAELVDLLRDLPDLSGVSGTADLVEELAPSSSDGRTQRRVGQRLFRLETLIPPTGVAGAAVIGDESHRGFVRESFAAFLREEHEDDRHHISLADRALGEGGVWLWVDDATPVSMAVRRRVVGGSARIGPVYTPPQRRGHGYASGVTAAASRSILDEAAVPVLFTNLANPTSNKIYQLLGYRAVEDRLVIAFG